MGVGRAEKVVKRRQSEKENEEDLGLVRENDMCERKKVREEEQNLN